jgi:hypothetical protein
MNVGTTASAGGGGSVGPLGGAAFGACSAPAAAGGFAAAGGRAAAGAAGFGAAGAAGFGGAEAAAAVGWPVAELVSLVVAVCAAAGFAGFGAGGSVRGSPVGAADAPAPGESVRETSAFNGSAGDEPGVLSPAASGGLGGFCGSSAIYTHSRAPFCQA